LFSVIAAAIETGPLIGEHYVHMKFACRRRHDGCKFDICVLMKALVFFVWPIADKLANSNKRIPSLDCIQNEIFGFQLYPVCSRAELMSSQ